MPRVRKKLDKFKGLKTSRKISLPFLIFIIVIGQVVGLLSIAAFSNLSQLISNIRIPDDVISLNLDISTPENMEACIPYYIENQGIYDLNGLFINSEIFINYIDKTNSKNVTTQILSRAGTLLVCRAFSSLKGNFTGSFTHFNITAVANFESNIDISKPFGFLVNIDFHANYFFNLIRFSIILNNIDLTGS